MTAITDRLGLARVVVMTPKRRLTVALPEQVPVSSLLPGLLRQGGDDLAIDGLTTGGWTLRRVDGTPLDVTRGLAPQGIHDGEMLCLVPVHQEWPEPDFDDVVDAIADGARRAQRVWAPSATRTCGLAVTVGTVLLITALLLLTPGAAYGSGLVLIGLAVVLTAGGTFLSRALSDAGAGAVVAAPATLVALAGGVLLAQGEDRPWFSPAHLMIGSAAMLLVAVAAMIGVADVRRVFVGAIFAALGGIAGAALAMNAPGTVGAAALLGTTVLLISPAYPILSVRMGQVPLPSVPRDINDLRTADTGPSFQDTVARVTRATDILTGLLLGTAVITLACIVVLALDGSTVPLILAGVISAAHLLRARMLVSAQQRLLPLVSGLVGLGVTATGLTMGMDDQKRLFSVVPVLIVFAIGSCVVALVHSRRAPSPRLGRWADIFDIVLTLAAAPLAASVLGLFSYMRGLAG
ncbi:type VII secretion integral membrane protein EccD [Kineosporia sp. NBRC 101731]|uniref:type VII secretion integral membrane protein EccD n=1 Tax=Kineosporia sp. NBRC 101731 TaxID=3032199 RepID=UPI0024A06F5B|nr:type VII secretion integral membrane protein EccD [Kineosporia sp. NBRC 101731]GLY27977.1 type VII secretion integral membrane protein EccD [Kineosporia sp. NBRC 101731]